MSTKQTSALQPVFDKHTPGPWHIAQTSDHRWAEISAEPGISLHVQTFASVRANKYIPNCGDDTVQANACLIAAAPELLEALELIIYDQMEGESSNIAVNKAIAAIAKARGQS